MRPEKPTQPAVGGAERRGRPRKWATEQERGRAAGQRRTARQRQVTALLAAVRNAWWEDAALLQAVNYGDDLALLEALTAYYRRRHWQWGRPAVPGVASPAAEKGAVSEPQDQ